ncbi:YjbQ family protein [bacterium]|nr:YjbQ family protein [bacterium]
MDIQTEKISLSTKGRTDIIDLTSKIARIVADSGMTEGQVTVFAPGATAGVSTVEYEPGLLQDIPDLMEKLIPSNISYHHDQTWHDGNGHSHLRATLMGPSMTIPFQDRQMTLGTWQQIILIDFDNRPRERNIVVQLIGK